jgi:hypothetical protein
MNINELIEREGVSIITIANSGYLDFTRNCIRSLENLGIFNLLKVYCVDENCYEELGSEYKNIKLLEHDFDEGISELSKYPKGDRQTTSVFKNIMFMKFPAITDALKNSKYVLFADSDIVFQNDNFLSHLLDALSDKDILFQTDSDGELEDMPCAGLMFMRNTESIRKFFNSNTALEDENWDTYVSDQDYVRENKDKLDYDYMSIGQFPNGRYFREHKEEINPHVVHYNWCKPNQKLKIMRRTGGWFI